MSAIPDVQSYIKTLDGGRTEDFAPRKLENKSQRFWDDFAKNAGVICVRVQTARRGAEYRPLYQFDRLPPLDQVPLYTPAERKYRYREMRRDDPAVVEAIAKQRAGQSADDGGGAGTRRV